MDDTIHVITTTPFNISANIPSCPVSQLAVLIDVSLHTRTRKVLLFSHISYQQGV